MKAFTLLASLTLPEKKAFDVVIKNKGRNSLSQLYLFLKKAPGPTFEKGDAFKAAFKENYSKDKDYLLRNELRLLANALKQFIVQREWEKATDENPHLANQWYLKALLSRKLHELYDSEYPDIYALAKDNVQLQLAMDLALDRFNRMNEDLAKHLDFDGMILASETYHQNLRELAAYKHRMYEHQRMTLDSISTKLGQATKFALPPAFRSDLLNVGADADTVLSKYYELIAQATQTDAATGVKHLQEALKLIEPLEIKGIDTNWMKNVCYNNLSIAFQELDDYEQAKKYGKKAFEISLPNGRHLGTIFGNYLRILIKTGRLKDARKLFNQYKDQFNDPVNFPNIFSAIIEGEIAMGDVDVAFDMVQEMATRSKTNYFTVKMCMIGAFYRKKEYALADNEITNVLQYMRDNASQGYDIDQDPHFFAIRQLLKLAKQASVNKKEIKKLAELYEAIPEEMKVVHRTSILLPWFYEQMEQFLKGKQPLHS